MSDKTINICLYMAPPRDAYGPGSKRFDLIAEFVAIDPMLIADKAIVQWGGGFYSFYCVDVPTRKVHFLECAPPLDMSQFQLAP